MADNLRDFRKRVAVLKKHGLLPVRSDSGSKLDARSVLPTWKVNGRKLETIVNKFDDVATDKATPVKASPAEIKKLRRVGLIDQSIKGKAIVPHAANEVVRIKDGNIVKRNKFGMERVSLPVEFTDLKSKLRELRANAKEINATKRRNEYFGIRFYGGQRANFYSSIQALINDLERYEAFRVKTSRAKQQEIYKHLEILRIDSAAARHVEKQVQERRHEASKESHAKSDRKYRKKIASSPIKKARRNAKIADRMKAYRAKLKTQPAKYKAYKAAAKKRAKKSRKKK